MGQKYKKKRIGTNVLIPNLRNLTPNFNFSCRSSSLTFSQFGAFDGCADEIQRKLNDHSLAASASIRNIPFEDHVESFANQSLPLDQQEVIINSIPNDIGVGAIKAQYLSTGSGGDNASVQYQPKSKRNRILHFWWRSDKYASQLRKELLLLLSPFSNTMGNSRKRDSTGSPRTSPKSIQREQVTSITNDDAFLRVKEILPGPPENHPRSGFTTFCQALVETEGLIQWRIHTDLVDIISFNSVDLANGGEFSKNKYCHMSRNVKKFKCTCEMYSTLQSVAYSMPVDTRAVDTSEVACLHILFFKEHILPFYHNLFSGQQLDDTLQKSLSRIHNRIMRSLSTLNIPVVMLGDGNSASQRLSVLGKDLLSCTLVNLRNERVSCENRECQSQKRNMSKLHDFLKTGKNICEHLQQLRDHQEVWCKSLDTEEDDTDSDSENINEDFSLTFDPDEDNVIGHTKKVSPPIIVLASRASGCLLDTQTLKNHHSGHPKKFKRNF